MFRGNPKTKYWIFFSFNRERPWLAFTEDKKLERAIKRAEYFLESGRRPDGDFIDSAFIYKAEYDEDDEGWSPVEGEPIWHGEADIKADPIEIEESIKFLSFWIDPYGAIYGVPIHGHAKVASMLVRAGIVPEDVEEGMFGSPPIRVGWLQVTTEPGISTTFNFETEPTQKQLDALFDLVLAHKSVEYSNNSRVFVEDSMKWLSHPVVTRKNPKNKKFWEWLLG